MLYFLAKLETKSTGTATGRKLDFAAHQGWAAKKILSSSFSISLILAFFHV